MPTNIYVGNLPWSTSDDELAEMFSQFGTVGRAQIVTDRETGRSRGFGFVEMPNDAEAQSAIQSLHEQPMNGRPLTVNLAQPRQERGPRTGAGAPRRDGGGYGGGRGDY